MVNNDNPRQLVVLILVLSILQGHFVSLSPITDPATHNQVKRQTRRQSNGNDFVVDVGDLLTSLISTGLRSATAFVTSGSEATQKVALAVGSAAVLPMLNVTRSFSRVQQTSRDLINGTQPLFNTDTSLFTLPRVTSTMTVIPTALTSVVSLLQRINEDLQPDVRKFGEALNQTFRASANGEGLIGSLLGRGSASGNVTRVNPNDMEIPDVIDWDA